MRDKQVKDESKRKKVEKKKEDQLDHLLVEKIKEELTTEEQEMRDRKIKELNRFQQVMSENEENQRRLREEAERERIEVHYHLFRTSRHSKSMQDFKTNLKERERKKRRSERRKSRQSWLPLLIQSSRTKRSRSELRTRR